MRKILALFVLAVFICVGCAKTTTVKPGSTDQRSIERSKEAHRDLERRTGN